MFAEPVFTGNVKIEHGRFLNGILRKAARCSASNQQAFEICVLDVGIWIL